MQPNKDIESGAGQELLDLLKTQAGQVPDRMGAEFIATRDAFRDLEKLTKTLLCMVSNINRRSSF